MKLSKDARLTMGLIGLLMLLGLGTAFLSRPTDPFLPRLDSQSSQEDGAKVLRLWLKELGYTVSTRRLEAFEISEEADVVLMLEPSVSVLASEARVVERWVEAGGKLLLVDSAGGAGAVMGRFEVGLGGTLGVERELVRQHPALRGPIPWESVTLTPGTVINTEREDVVVYLADEDLPLVVGFKEGEGEVVVATVSEVMTNLSLQSEDQAAFAAALVGLIADEGETIWIDDWHHGRRIERGDSSVVGTGAWLRQTPIGQSFLLAAGIGALAIVLSGRGFGRPIPLPENKVRRAPLEYVTAIGNLNRRAGNRQAVLAEYKKRFKRDLGRRYRIDASLDDAEYLRQLKHANPQIDSGSVHNLLVRLSQQDISESELVALASDLQELKN